MAILIVIPGIALVGILGKDGLAEPDMAFPYLVKTYLPVGLKGIILCALFASLMSTVDSTFNSLATLWSIDIYKGYLKKDANDQEVVGSGKNAILVSLISGIVMGLILLHLKFSNPDAAFTHTLNELRYYINCGIVVLICSAGFLLYPKQKTILIAFFSTFAFQVIILKVFPEMNYFVRAMWVIILGLAIVIGSNFGKGAPLKSLIQFEDRKTLTWGIGLVLSLILVHIVFH